MIASRSFTRFGRAWRVAHSGISSNKPIVFFQGCKGYHGSYFNIAMNSQKKQKAFKPVWRPVSTQAASVSTQAFPVSTQAVPIFTQSNSQDVLNVDKVHTGGTETEKHSVEIEVAATVIRFMKGKGDATYIRIGEETGTQIIFPSAAKGSSIVIEGVSLESVTKASERMQAIIQEAVKSPKVDYSHFISLPLAIHPELVEKLKNFRVSILENSGSSKNENADSDSDEKASTDVAEDKEKQLDGGVDVAVIQMKRLPSDMGIHRSIFIKPKTFHLTVLMLKLWNKELIAKAAEILQSVSSKVMDALEGRPVFVKLKGLECMKGSLEKAYVLYTPIEVIGGDERLLHACQIITDAYVEAGLVLEKDAQQTLKLHGTVMNARHMKRNKRKQSRPFDARSIVEKYGSEEWGEYPIPQVHLSQRHVFDESGYYHCCASIRLPEEKQEYFER